MRTAEQKRNKNKIFTVNKNKLHRFKVGVKSELKLSFKSLLIY